MSQAHSLTDKRLAFSSIYPLLVDRIGRDLRFCHLEFDMEAISDVLRVETPVSVGGF